jgi:catechol 2,3-dioxygenase-like lactoylglutathione lyase family enzyme
MLSTIKQIAVAVSDLEASKAFYRDKLGLKLLFEAPPGLVFFDCAGIWLMIAAENEKDRAHPGSVLYFEVSDIERAHADLTARGVEFISKPHKVADMGTWELWLADFRDPDGTLLAIREEKKK